MNGLLAVSSVRGVSAFQRFGRISSAVVLLTSQRTFSCFRVDRRNLVGCIQVNDSLSTNLFLARDTLGRINLGKRSGNGITQQKIRKSTISAQSQSSAKQELPSFVTEHKFEEVSTSVINPRVNLAIKKMGISQMTEIQYKTMKVMGMLTDSKIDPTTVDILGRARAGTGKTIAFLLPTLYHLGSIPNLNPNKVSVLIVSPTREVATQIADQARELTKFVKDYSVQVMYGGKTFNANADLSKIRDKVPTILVATPGRLNDHLKNSHIQGMGPFSDLFRETKVGIFDEADQMLDMGLRKDILSILSYLPPRGKRQTLFFSATVPNQLKSLMGVAMRRNFKTADCIRDGTTESSLNVRQSHVILPAMNRIVIGVLEVLQKAQQDPAHKIIVFFQAARLVAYYEGIFQSMGMNVLAINSQKSQFSRGKVSEQFRSTKNAVLLSSDIIARGVHYPDITHVIQVGLPSSKDIYIRRLGMTGRGGKEGIGWLVLAPFEATFVKKDLKDIDCPKNEDLAKIFSTRPEDRIVREILPGLQQVQERKKLKETARQAYAAWLGFYLQYMKRIGQSKASLVDLANQFAHYAGLAQQPHLDPRLAGDMGLNGVPGVLLKSEDNERSLRVQQSHVVLPAMDRIIIGVLEVIQKAQQDPDHKIIVFFPVARLVAYFEELFEAMDMNVFGIHTRISQKARKKVSEQFRNEKNAVLLSSARGFRYPDVTHVIQVGLPISKEQYINRLRSAGRGGKEGIGWLVLAPFEKRLGKTNLKAIDCPRNEDLTKIFRTRPKERTIRGIARGLRKFQTRKNFKQTVCQAYVAWLRFYLQDMKRVGQSKVSLVDLANQFAHYAGLAEQPHLDHRFVVNMGLKGVPGVIIESNDNDEYFDSGRGRL